MIDVNKNTKNILAEMAKKGDDVPKFTFNKVAGDKGGTDVNRVTGVIIMGVTNRQGNKVHEVSHGWHQSPKGKHEAEEADETRAYTAQYAADPSSMPLSVSPWPVQSIWDVTGRYVGGILDPKTGEALYKESYKKYKDEYKK